MTAAAARAHATASHSSEGGFTAPTSDVLRYFYANKGRGRIVWTTETLDDHAADMAETDATAREAGPGPGLLMIIDAGEVDMEILASLFD